MVELSDGAWRRIDDLLFDLYAISDVFELRKRFMAGFKELVPYAKGFFDLCDCSESGRYVFFDPVSVDMTDDELLSYYRTYEPADYVAWLFSGDEPVVYRDSTLVSDEARERSVLYREWMRPMNIHFSMGSTQVANGTIYGSVTLFRERDAADFAEDELECLAVLNRHLSALLARAHPGGLRRDATGRPAAGRPELTEREQEIVALIAEGMSNQQIGLRLFISENTVKKHVKSVYHKLGVSSRHQLMAALYRDAAIVVDTE